MKKIIFLIPTLYSSPVEGALILASEFKSLGYSVEVIVLKKNGNLNKKYSLLNYTYLSQSIIVSQIFFLRKYISHQKKKGFDVRIISFTFLPDLINFFLKDIAKTYSSVRGDLKTNYFYNFFPFGFLVYRFHYYLISKMYLIFSMTNFMKVKIKEHCNRKSYVVGNFINENIYKSKIKKRGKYENKKKINFLFLGNVKLLKKPFSLISIANQLEKKKFKFSIMIIGNYSILTKLLMQFFLINKNNIKFLGFKKNPYLYFNKADFLLHTSISEGISRSVIESLYCKVPVIIRNSFGTKEYVNKKNGFLFKNENDICNFFLNKSYLKFLKRTKISKLPKLIQKQNCVKLYEKIVLKY